MKRIVAVGVGVLLLVAVAMIYSVRRASLEPVTHTPGPVETGRVQLHAQLEQARQIEGQGEKQHWNSATALRAMIAGHEQRLGKLKDNKEAAEIVAYDQDAIDRLEKRVAQIAEEETARAEAAAQAARAAARQAAQPAQPQ